MANHDDFYKQLREKIVKYVNSEEGKKNKFTEYLLLAPDLFHLLTKLIMDPEVDAGDKVKLGIAIAYFVSPIDLIPDIIIGAGQLDDIAVAAYALNGIINKSDRDIVKNHWAGDADILETISGIIKSVDDMVGAGLFKAIIKMFEGK